MKSNLDATEILTEDHRTVARLFDAIEAQSSMERRESLFLEVYSELEAHSNAEEEVLYPRAEQLDDTEDLAEQSAEEHMKVRELLARLQVIEVDNDQWMGIFYELKKNVEHHVREEEGRLFPALRRLLEDDELHDMGQAIERTKQDYRKAG
jgi:hemerythrin superfamily protein